MILFPNVMLGWFMTGSIDGAEGFSDQFAPRGLSKVNSLPPTLMHLTNGRARSILALVRGRTCLLHGAGFAADEAPE